MIWSYNDGFVVRSGWVYRAYTDAEVNCVKDKNLYSEANHTNVTLEMEALLTRWKFARFVKLVRAVKWSKLTRG